MESFVFGESANGLPITAFQFENRGPRVLILGGVHGDEPEGVILAQGLLKKCPFPDIRLTIVPLFNIDGILNQSRVNSRGVDLNRNLPTKDWTAEAHSPRYTPGPEPCSEPENKALVKFLSKDPPDIVFSLHSWKPMLNTNGDCLLEAKAIQKLTNYEIKDFIGYPTPGSLGTYCGLERNIPTLTYEIERGLDSKSILKCHIPALCEALKVTAKERSHKSMQSNPKRGNNSNP